MEKVLLDRSGRKPRLVIPRTKRVTVVWSTSRKRKWHCKEPCGNREVTSMRFHLFSSCRAQRSAVESCEQSVVRHTRGGPKSVFVYPHAWCCAAGPLGRARR